ncbi:MAG: hypothetical protein AB1486_11505 [Planctomycetota bacterium]
MRRFLERALFAIVPLWLASGWLLCGCSSGGGGGGSGGGASGEGARVALLLKDQSAERLFSLHTTISRIVLVNRQGEETKNLLADPVTLEMVELRGWARLLATGLVTPDTYSTIAVTFAVDGVQARVLETSGSELATAPVRINIPSRTFTMTLTPRLTALDSGYYPILLDIDLADSLDGELGVRPLEFVPTGPASVMEATQQVSLAPTKGIVRSVGSDRFEIEAYADGDLHVPGGSVSVRLSDGSLLLGRDRQEVAARSAFLSELRINRSVVDVQGDFTGEGALRARYARLEDEEVQSYSPTTVEIDGIVLGKEDGEPFSLLIRNIVRSSEFAQAMLASLGNPLVIPVLVDANTPFVVEGTHTAGLEALFIGQQVRVSFSFFGGFPFPAALVAIRSAEPLLKGSVVSVAGLPASVIMHADADNAAVIAGQIDSQDTDVEVDLSQSSVIMDTSGSPLVDAASLRVGLRVNVRAMVSGPPSSPQLAASETLIKPGRFIGVITSGDQAAGALEVRVRYPIDSFGEEWFSRRARVLLADSTVVWGDARSVTRLFGLLEEIGFAEELQILVKGVSTGVTDEVVAHEIRVWRQAPLTGSDIADSKRLWPADGALHLIDLRCVVPHRPGADGIREVEVFSIEQDEPVDPSGTGTAPDGVILGDGCVLVRAEREAALNGRVYIVTYANPRGTTPATLRVTVPVKGSTPAQDDGLRYDSTKIEP